MGLFAAALFLALASPRREPQPYPGPGEVEFRSASILSEGTRRAAELCPLKDQGGTKLPTILMAHGWGGTALALRPDAVKSPRAGDDAPEDGSLSWRAF